METEQQVPVERKPISFNLRAKLIVGFALISAFVSFITARGIYTNLKPEIIAQFREQILLQSIGVFIVALVLGIFFGYVAGNALTEPINKLTEGASAFAAGNLEQHIEITTRDEVEGLANTFNAM